MSNITEQKNSVNNVFDDCPEFYLDDNRKNRLFNPVTKEMLENKLNVLLQPACVKGKNILDLGSCLGAAGQWALYHGAAFYTGVELQESYAGKSRELLKPWGGRARIFQRDIRTFVENTNEDSYDIVLMAGVLYLFVDPQNIIEQMCRVAKEAVVVETNYPPSIRAGKMPAHAAITEYIYEQEVNLSDVNESLLGISATSSLRAIDLMFGINGFGKNEPKLNFPKNKNMLNYSDEDIVGSKIPLRFAVCYRKNNSTRMKTLEDNLPKRTGFRRSWEHNLVSRRRTRERNKISRKFDDGIKPWKFDEEIAKNFLSIAEQEIPDYHRVIEKTVQVINKCGFQNPRIIDVGSATGETLKRLYREGYRNLYGVENSKAMLDCSFDKAALILSEHFPVDKGPFDVVIANWVLHFVNERDEYLQMIKRALSHNGILILTEKLVSSSLAHSLYDDFKRHNGMTDGEIANKRERLKGVLTPCSLIWYLEALRKSGFGSVDIINANSVFVTFFVQNNNIGR